MRVVVIGETGQLASCLRDLGRQDWCFLGRGKLDLAVPQDLEQALDRFGPDAVVNAAAYTAVDKAESDRDLAFTVNEKAPAAMARWCARAGVPLLHVSTDYVFDGSGDRAWREDDEPAPLNVYGASKLGGERAVLASGAKALILRTSWVHSPYGGNFLKTMLKLAARRDELAVVADQRGAPTSAQDLAEAIAALLPLLHGGKVNARYHCSGAGATNWASFAEAIFSAALEFGMIARAPAIRPIRSEDYPTPARRPRNSVLSCDLLLKETGVSLPGWRLGMRRTLAALAAMDSAKGRS